jgi:hypothetical protein
VSKPARFEVTAALVVGVLLPFLETIRRGPAHWKVDAATMLEDYVGGALLLASGWLSLRSSPRAPLLLLTAWAAVTAMMSISFWDQLESTIRGVDLEAHHEVVLVFKFLLWSTSLASLLLSFRAASSRPPGGP